MSSVPDKNWISSLREFLASPYVMVAFIFATSYLVFTSFRRTYPTYDDADDEEEKISLDEPLQDLCLTETQLGEYNSQRTDKRYLVAFKGIIYDVSNAPYDFGPEGPFEMLTGKKIDDMIKNIASSNNRNENKLLEGWGNTLEDLFYTAGVLVAEETQQIVQAEDAIGEDKPSEELNDEFKGKVNQSESTIEQDNDMNEKANDGINNKMKGAEKQDVNESTLKK